ncbi:MAG: oligosaccharide flippase family protein [Microgenomates group bacterium]
MEETQSYQQLKRNSLVSTLSLFFQSGYTALLGLVANLVVTILLSPAIFGMYITVLSLISVLNYFSDIGLAASLIQKKETDPKDFSTTFTVQQILTVSLVMLGFLITNTVMQFYKLPPEGTYLYWALLGGFFFSSLKTIPSILLERKIQFQKIVLVQVLEGTVFYITIIICAIAKLGLNSFTIAVVLRSLVGVTLIYYLSPWTPQFGISRESLRSLLKFGLPFQASSFLALFKDDLIMLFLGKVVGFTGVGYIGWAKKWAEAPIRIIMDNITKVLFPVISRLQHDKEKIGQLIEKIIFFQTAILAPVILGMLLSMEHIVFLIPKYAKWLPALPIFYLFCFSAFLSSFSSPLLNLINALGQAKIVLIFMAIWTVITWILTPLLTYFFSYFGFPITVCIISLSSVLVVLIAKRFVHFRFLHATYKPFLSALMMGLVIGLIKLVVTHHLTALILSVLLGGTTYLSTLYFVFNVNMVKEVKLLFLRK